MAFTIDITDVAEDQLAAIRVVDRRRIIDAIERNLTHQPDVPSRNRKELEGASPQFEHEPPIWELRVGEFRVYYDVNGSEQVVYVRRVQRKKPHQTTEETFHEEDRD